jgi:hypothetical protein
MPNLKFNQLLVLSNSTKSGNVFNFSSRLNLITALDNSVGKSTLIKLLSWGLGCEPFLDTTWKGFDTKTLVKFSIGSTQYQVMRYNNIMHFKEGNNSYIKYTKITGEYSKKFAEIVSFKALLFKRNSEVLETPPPAFYFLPFYIDQKKSWAYFWEHFDNLHQYENWKTDILNYHIGLYTTDYFNLLQDIYNERIVKHGIQAEINKMETTLSVVNSYIPAIRTTINKIEFEKITDEIRVQLSALSADQEKLFDRIARYESEKAYLEHQKAISNAIIADLESDYKFSVENLPTDQIECPLCGTIHENSVVSRASILTDKLQAESQLVTIVESLSKINSGLLNTKKELDKVKRDITRINEKYVIEDENQRVELADIIDSFASTSIQKKVEDDRKIQLVALSAVDKKIKSLNEEKKDIIPQEHKDLISEKFFNFLSYYVQMLDAEGINLSEIKSPGHFNKLFNEGGAADGIRAAMAFYISIYSMSAQYCDQVIASLLVDTPNQQEQSEKNYDKAIDFLIKEIPIDRQIILAAMENPQLKNYKDNANIILLDKNKILNEDLYLKVKEEFDLVEPSLD